MLIDIGVNLMNPAFDKDREQVIENAANAGVSPLIVTGANEKSSYNALKYTENYPGKLYATAGVHPHEARFCNDDTIPVLRELAVNQKAVAIGECGLDYNRDFSPRPVQREWFEKQLSLAVELRLPLFLHERDAHTDFFPMLKNVISHVPAAVLHCFTGTEEELEACLDIGCYIGITGWICDERRGTHLVNLVKTIPPDRLMLETDAPYLLPRDLLGAKKGSRNEPKYLPHIAETIARHIGKDRILLEEETYNNSKLFFNI